MTMRVWPGRPYPLGATWDGIGVNFAVFSEHASAVELCLFREEGDAEESTKIQLTERTDQVWHCYLPDARPGQYYGYRVHGPYAPATGQRFNAAKLLIDPYAKAITGAIQWSNDLFAYRVGPTLDDTEPDPDNSAGGVPKSVVIDSAFTWGDDAPLNVPYNRTVIYECHVKGMTMRHPDVPPELRGTYLGLCSDPMLEYFQGLGVTALELLPVHQFVVDRHLAQRGLTNYWGYNSIGFFAPDVRYATRGLGNQVYEFKTMVKTLHQAGLEVILDVVYNHTGEGNHLGPTLSMKGIDNSAYYRLEPGNQRFYTDFTGTGNSLNMQHPRTIQLVMDSLRYWVDDMHVDGFRFDLAPVLARELYDVDKLSAFFDIMHQDPTLARVKLIAEPWDVGPGGYQAGNFPVRWTEWNGKYRDAVRKFWRGDPGQVSEMASRLAGSSDIFSGSDRGVYASINFITAHDGYTLRDLVSYEQKHNEANGENNQDGHSDNLSRNWGIEGETDNPEIVALRYRLMRSFLATLAFSQGVPMLAHGDELARTQGGNNNAYAQDNEITWVNWELSDEQTKLKEFMASLLVLRQAHPVLRRRHFFRGAPVPGSEQKDVTWVRPDGKELTDVDWRNPDVRTFGMLIDGAATDEVDERGHAVSGDSLLIVLNAGDTPVSFTLPTLAGEGKIWVIMVDTARDEVAVLDGATLCVHAHALMLVRYGADRRVPPIEEPRREPLSVVEKHTLMSSIDAAERRALTEGRHSAPHNVLGPHEYEDKGKQGTIVRVYQPDAADALIIREGVATAMREEGEGFFSIFIPGMVEPFRYSLRFIGPDGHAWERGDPYRHAPTLGDMDLYLFNEGTHRRLWTMLGAHLRTEEGDEGTAFVVWAPNAERVSVVGDWCNWDGRQFPMRRMGESGLWEIFIPGIGANALYEFELRTRDGDLRLKSDPMGLKMQQAPDTASIVVNEANYRWHDGTWMTTRAHHNAVREPMHIYEVHPGSWARVVEDGGRSLSYRELAPRLAQHVKSMGFTHVELLPVMEHPFYGSWGYQITGYFAPSSRYGSPDDLRFFIDTLHQAGIGVLLDWVPAHFPRDDYALRRFDGTALYEHEDPRLGEHPDWGTLIFNYGRKEVRNFLVANALYWLNEFHIDGLRVDAVASMLYLDYSREAGQWVPNKYGGRENLEAIDFLREMNAVVHQEAPGCVTIAEDSTAWPGVTRSIHDGGLGFTFKWNMGWMHDTLEYFSKDPIYRKFHQDLLTFAMIYEHSENFIMPLSHDEMVHLKGSLYEKMPGDRWQKLANLRALFAYMLTRPGKSLLFMGSELALPNEWNHDQSLDWHLEHEADRAGFRDYMARLGNLYQQLPPLWQLDSELHGFEWIDVSDKANSVLSFLRRSNDGHAVVVLNLTPTPHAQYRIGVPESTDYSCVLNSDATQWGGSGYGGTTTVIHAEDIPYHGRRYSIELALPPLSATLLVPAGEAPTTT